MAGPLSRIIQMFPDWNIPLPKQILNSLLDLYKTSLIFKMEPDQKGFILYKSGWPYLIILYVIQS